MLTQIYMGFMVTRHQIEDSENFHSVLVILPVSGIG